MQIHQFENNGYKIVLDVPSGSVHVADDLMYDVIKAAAGYLGVGDTADETPGPGNCGGEAGSSPALSVTDRGGIVHTVPFPHWRMRCLLNTPPESSGKPRRRCRPLRMRVSCFTTKTTGLRLRSLRTGRVS